MSQTALTIGTEYTERLLIGTGTESDPWIIGGYTDTSQDLQNLLDAIGTSGAYIKMAKDIDAAQDITYREGIDHYINIACAKLYADAKTKVSGLKIKADYALYCMDSALHYVERIQFLSFLHYGTKSTLQGSANGGGVYCKECDFSIIKHCDGAAAQCSDLAFGFDYCSLEFSAIGYSTTTACNIFSTTLRFYHTQIHYVGPVFGSAYYYNYLVNNGERVGITGALDVRVSLAYLFSGCSYCCLAGKIANNTTAATLASKSSSNTLICTTEISGSYDTALDGSLTELTADQLKDREYLYSINFLP